MKCLTQGMTILAIQTNVLTQNKLERTPNEAIKETAQHIIFTEQAAATAEPIDLIVWPETTLPGLGLEPEAIKKLVDHGGYPGDIYAMAMAEMRDAWGFHCSSAARAYVGLHIEGEFWRGEQQFNSAYLIEGTPPYERYDKISLTPFGEYMPIISNWDWLEAELLALVPAA